MKIKYFLPDCGGEIPDDIQEMHMDRDYDMSDESDRIICFQELADAMCLDDWDCLDWWKETDDSVHIAIFAPNGDRFDCDVSVEYRRIFRATLLKPAGKEAE